MYVNTGLVYIDSICKESPCIKGTVPCFRCSNVLGLANRELLTDGLVCINCTDRGSFQRRTNNDVFEIIDRMVLLEDEDTLKVHEQTNGMVCNPRGLLLNFSLRDRGILQPLDNYLRDWMHTFVSGGQANTHTALLVHALKQELHIKHADISTFIQGFNLPHKHGKVSAEWIHKNRFKTKDRAAFASYASVMLSLVPLVNAFFIDVVQSSGAAETFEPHIVCYGLLASILALLQRVDVAPSCVDHLVQLIDEYGRQFIALYDRAKSKFHDMYHIHEGIVRFGRVLSCFVTERKHRQTKKAALHVFRHLEKTVLTDMINRMCESFRNDECLFQPSYLLMSKSADILGRALKYSHKAVLHCGLLVKGDIVFATYPASVIVGVVKGFWQCNDAIVVHVDTLSPMNPGHDITLWSDRAPVAMFVQAAAIVDAVPWRRHAPQVVRIIAPYFS